MMKPAMEPIGRQVSSVGRTLARAFDAALEGAGGSLPVWLVLMSLKRAPWRTQYDLARAVGIQSPTMTRHLDNFEAAGLVSRHRDPGDRRVMRIELTDSGNAMFQRLRHAAADFDRQLRAGFTDEELEQLSLLLGRLKANVEGAGSVIPVASDTALPDP